MLIVKACGLEMPEKTYVQVRFLGDGKEPDLDINDQDSDPNSDTC